MNVVCCSSDWRFKGKESKTADYYFMHVNVVLHFKVFSVGISEMMLHNYLSLQILFTISEFVQHEIDESPSSLAKGSQFTFILTLFTNRLSRRSAIWLQRDALLGAYYFSTNQKIRCET